MKILTVAIPNHHFFQWVNQLEDSGYEVFWFDVTDGGPPSDKISWVTQIKGWKLRWDFPLRTSIKSKLPKLYKWVQRGNERDVTSAFAKAYKEIQPDIVHCFEMQLSGFPILPMLLKMDVPLIYSSWGSDLYHYKERGVSPEKVTAFLDRVDYLITDCRRDYKIANDLGFKKTFLGVYPGNGGLSLPQECIKDQEQRSSILIKGYEDGVGKASVVLSALEFLEKGVLEGVKICIYSGDDQLLEQIKASSFLTSLNMEFHSRYNFINNEVLLKKMGKSLLHIGNSISDGMPNALLEAMGMGAFPVQSNPGGASEEVVLHAKNGFLIKNPLDEQEIAQLITAALASETFRKSAQDYNTSFIHKNYNRSILRPQIVALYNQVNTNHHA